MTASYVSRYGYLVAECEADVLILYAAAYLHDTIEDARMTYNDVVKFIRDFREGNIALPEDLLHRIKMCDRLANIQYTTMFVFANHMLDVYRREFPDFIRSIDDGAVMMVPDVMKKEAERLLAVETYVI